MDGNSGEEELCLFIMAMYEVEITTFMKTRANHGKKVV
jgi:hypothetical protein